MRQIEFYKCRKLPAKINDPRLVDSLINNSSLAQRRLNTDCDKGKQKVLADCLDQGGPEAMAEL